MTSNIILKDEAEDILYKVICELLEKKNDSRLIDFMHEKKKNGTTLDFYVLGAIKYKVLQWQTFHQLKSSVKRLICALRVFARRLHEL